MRERERERATIFLCQDSFEEKSGGRTLGRWVTGHFLYFYWFINNMGTLKLQVWVLTSISSIFMVFVVIGFCCIRFREALDKCMHHMRSKAT